MTSPLLFSASLRDLNFVLSALQNTDIELIRDNPLSTLTYKVVFLVAITSARWVSQLKENLSDLAPGWGRFEMFFFCPEDNFCLPPNRDIIFPSLCLAPACSHRLHWKDWLSLSLLMVSFYHFSVAQKDHCSSLKFVRIGFQPFLWRCTLLDLRVFLGLFSIKQPRFARMTPHPVFCLHIFSFTQVARWASSDARRCFRWLFKLQAVLSSVVFFF